MRRLRHITTWGLAAFLAAGLALPARAATLQVAPDTKDLQAVLDRAVDGDEISLSDGTYRGPLRVTHSITLTGSPGTTITADGQGTVITVTAPGTVIRGLTIRGSGHSLEQMDSGVFVEQAAHDTLIENNHIEGNLFGVYLHGSANALVRHNSIIGLRATHPGGAGNGVSVWNAPGAKVIDNDIRYGRDGVFVITSRNNVFSNNRFSDLRFAIHDMYANDGEITGNVSTRNIIGYAMMFSKNLVVKDNVSDHDRDRGMLFNATNGSQISGNSVIGGLQPAERWATAENRGADEGVPQTETRSVTQTGGVRPGPEKCVFVYNTNNNRITDNWFEGCEIGVHFTAGSEGNDIRGNAFVNNASQIKYVGTRHLDWSKNGRGNYWSDNPGFDLNGDGVADTAYRPNDLIDRVLWTAPAAKVLINSPAVQVIRWAQALFPAILPGGVVDSHPLMSPPARRTAAGSTPR
ncbi:copper ABC transporter, periplasmic binding protein NosD [Bradyrhizobium sp. ORS 285]|uniref:nitrous oxide reductase family maturation protein NosD n=1 Tax=Bradyrhizobium sp. ORS 285 TaxID=115808 RepID=UPI0002408412|nr:nitrous oxide reductase family maturation protein NosD [Bradyrhizobium sp. ORS 285]CCD86230.1 copper ABC transporter, periplasmic binding protein NosD [Bradyrhizobium sp. ORS 285]SMX61003.1 copper ABC transporter, periplasmic binding protein NosD [Bradyrhizobium sp. ORS 285]